MSEVVAPGLEELAPELAVECQGLSQRFGSVQALDGVEFTVRRGEVFGLLGPNGAGKTTTIRVLVTLLRPDSGTIRVFGLDVVRQAMAVRRAIGYVPQQLSADQGLSGYENVWLFAKLFDVPRSQLRARIQEALALMGLEEAARRPVVTYSGGMVRRLELAQALVNRPRLLVLDEPTIGLDPVARAGVWQRVQELRARTGMTVLLTTHYMDEADRLCDRVALMHRGRIVALDTPARLKESLGQAATLDDVFRHYTGSQLEESGSFRDVRSTRRTARRLG
ncbi:MAG TPA: ATP-binding cassette domain-containing protein [Candidatus Dormibacteraeota bacterium]|nr:ATP-binding cassette domain-containing protein [Candidatus Dormibacteraeota bacterium]